jgi:hypothetical protein
MSRPADPALARRWSDRVRFVIDPRGEIVPEWRYPDLIPERLRAWFDSRVRAQGPSLGLVAELEGEILRAAGRLPPEAELGAILDSKGFSRWSLD